MLPPPPPSTSLSTRWDHMQQHSGQHLLSAVLERSHGTNTLSWWMAETARDKVLVAVVLELIFVMMFALELDDVSGGRLLHRGGPAARPGGAPHPGGRVQQGGGAVGRMGLMAVYVFVKLWITLKK